MTHVVEQNSTCEENLLHIAISTFTTFWYGPNARIVNGLLDFTKVPRHGP